MHRRWDEFMLYPHVQSPRASHRRECPTQVMPSPRTLGEARRHHIWMWVKCGRRRCYTTIAAPLVPLIIRWRDDMPLEEAGRRFRCSGCGGLGMRLVEPSHAGGDRRCITEIHRWTGVPGQGLRLGVREMS